MATGIPTVKGKAEFRKKINLVIKKYEKALLEILNRNSILLASYTRVTFLRGGTTGTKLRMRSGKLARSCLPIRAKVVNGEIKAGIKFGTMYAKTHIGDDKLFTEIRAKPGKFLAIPLAAAKTAAGVARGKPRDPIFGDTFVKKSKKGKLIIFGKKVSWSGNTGRSGGRSGKSNEKIVPLFLLVKSVKIKKRVSPKLLIKWVKPKIIKELKEVKL